jgi:hypothetical protein
MGVFFWIILSIIVISSVVGMIAKALSNFQEQQQQQARLRPARFSDEEPSSGGRSTTNKDMERFRAELERLRRKNQQSRHTATEPSSPPPVVPVIPPVKKPSRPSLVMEVPLPAKVEPTSPEHPSTPPPPPPPAAPSLTVPEQFAPQPAPPPPPVPPPAAPYATTPPATADFRQQPAQVARLAPRPRPSAKTPLAHQLTSLLSSGQGLALAIIMQEIFGPPRCRRLHRFPPL